MEERPVEIIFHAHHAAISDHMRGRAERAVRKVAARVPRATSAVVRFEEDGPTRRVEIELLGTGQKLVSVATGRFFGPALSDAAQRLLARAGRGRRDKNKKHLRRPRALATA